MQINLIAVGTRMPRWVNEGYQQYAQWLPRDYQLKLLEIPLQKRTKNTDIEKILLKESEQILAAVPKHHLLIVLDSDGESFESEKLAHYLQVWHDENTNISLVIGGPEGLAEICFKRAQKVWSLSALTLPHPLVRVIVAEQIYRAVSIIQGHPYHRE